MLFCTVELLVREIQKKYQTLFFGTALIATLEYKKDRMHIKVVRRILSELIGAPPFGFSPTHMEQLKSGIERIYCV